MKNIHKNAKCSWFKCPCCNVSLLQSPISTFLPWLVLLSKILILFFFQKKIDFTICHQLYVAVISLMTPGSLIALAPTNPTYNWWTGTTVEQSGVVNQKVLSLIASWTTKN